MKNKKKTNDVLIIQKYKSSWVGVVSMLVTTVICLLCYIIVLILLQNEQVSNNYGEVLNVIRDILLMVVSIVATALLTSVFIEKNKKNIDYTELMANDILALPEFYTNLTDDNKEKIHKYLEENMFLKNPVKSEIYRLCREQVNNNAQEYYYNELHICVSYFERKNYSEKKINRVMRIRSYEKKIKEDKLFLFTYQLSPTEGIKNFELLSAGIGIKNDPLIIGKDIIIEQKDTTDMFWNKCGYKQTYEVYLCKDVTLSAEQDTILTLEYISRVSDGDMSMGVGVSVPCRRFNFSFTAPSDYTVYAHPYGFLNSDTIFPNSEYPYHVSVCYSRWLLPGEGVSISVAKKAEQINQENEVFNKDMEPSTSA